MGVRFPIHSALRRALPQAVEIQVPPYGKAMEKLWKSRAEAMEKLCKTHCLLDFTTTQQFTTGRDAPPLHPFCLFFIEKEQVRFFGGKESAAKRRASARPCQSNTAHTTPHKATFGGSEDPTTPCKALGSCPPHKTKQSNQRRLQKGIDGTTIPNNRSQRFRLTHPPLSAVCEDSA